MKKYKIEILHSNRFESHDFVKIKIKVTDDFVPGSADAEQQLPLACGDIIRAKKKEVFNDEKS